MCGICGELRWDQQPIASNRLHAMLNKLERRGPDSHGIHIDEPIAFGHRRLKIIDLSEQAKQPMIDSQLGLHLVFNGTIYNYKILREQLLSKGYSFQSTGDSEVIIKAYHAWGEQCVSHLNGMFAFAIWDKQAQKLFIARDRLGIKPLYYQVNPHFFRFASNTQALLVNADVDTRIDDIALHHQLTLHAVIPAPRTILKGIRKLAPGHSMSIDSNGKQRFNQYWQLTAQRTQSLSQREWVERIRESLLNAVKIRSDIADVPVGVLLSGGLDSSLLVALLAETGNQPLTFSVGFEDTPEEQGNEFYYSDMVVEKYKTQHQKFLLPNSAVLKQLPNAIKAMAEPMVGQDAVAFYLLAEQVSQHVKVVQSGQGADEVFAGYFWYPRMQNDTGSALERFRKHYFDRDHNEYLASVTAAYHGHDYTSALIQDRLSQPAADTFMDQVLRMDVTMLITDDPVKRVDNMTMAWGLEARVPFLDHELVELAAQMPPEMKLQRQGKYPLKMIARGLLPDPVIDRKKGYFPVPALKYIRGEFLDFMRDILNSQACINRNLFQRTYVQQLLSAPENYSALQGNKLWHIALLEYWFQLNIDK